MGGLRYTSLFFRGIDNTYKVQRLTIKLHWATGAWHWPRVTYAIILPGGNMHRVLRAAALGRLDSGILGIFASHAEA